MSTILSSIGVNETYPKSSQVLLWIASAIGVIITAVWFLVHSFDHDSYVRQREFNRIIEQQKEFGSKLDRQTDLIIKLYEKQ